ncbi:MAG: Xaa-Pro dipeptidase, partial [Holophaga sp.]|nr:Xaa-Pro dipeptidase [Holophaga sp.]
MSLTELFLEHLKVRLEYAERALAANGFDCLVISSGRAHSYFADDQDAPFNTVPHFRHYCPITGPHHVLKLQPGRKPVLVRFAPEDFWYEQLPLGTPFWLEGFDLVEAPSLEAVWAAVGRPERAAYIGNEPEPARAAGMETNPAGLTAFLDWGRSYKTPYEIQCLEQATVRGAKAHLAARQAFLAGASELEIHYAFVAAAECLEFELAFPSIVAMNEKGATLHYENKRNVRNGKTLLLDCGARTLGYASDITRVTTAPGCDPRFQALVAGMEKNQKELAAAVAPRVPFGDLHHLSHVKLAALLKEHGILNADPEQAVELGLTRPFYPHGLGHPLGIQVHDVAGKLAGPDGSFAPPPARHPSLRTTRVLEPGQVVTIEPGCYFIPMLLQPFRESSQSHRFNWKLIDQLSPMGGIRIEDNLLVTATGGRNLTRE